MTRRGDWGRGFLALLGMTIWRTLCAATGRRIAAACGLAMTETDGRVLNGAEYDGGAAYELRDVW